MSQSNNGISKGFYSANALAEGVAVKLSAAGQVVAATAATDKVIGVTASACDAATTVSVKLRSAPGTYKVKLGGTVAINDFLTATTGGALIATAVSGNTIVAMALEAGVSGDFIEALVMNDRV